MFVWLKNVWGCKVHLNILYRKVQVWRYGACRQCIIGPKKYPRESDSIKKGSKKWLGRCKGKVEKGVHSEQDRSATYFANTENSA